MSEETKHTPGPWWIDLESAFTLGGDSRSVEALTPDGKMVTRGIADLMFDTDEHPDGPGFLEDVANARLIMAAPDLLAALKLARAAWLHESAQGDGVMDEHKPALAIVDAAIAKAEGGAE